MVKNLNVPETRFPKIPKNISLEQILPAIRTIVKRKDHSYEYPGLEVKPGKKYLMICDSTNDTMVMEALSLAIRDGGGSLKTIISDGYPGMTEPIDLVDTMFARNHYPSWVWDALAEVDVIIWCVFFLHSYTPNLPASMTEKTSVMMYLTRDLCLPQVQDFPLELRAAIDKKTWESMVYSKKIELTDPEGTDLKWSATREGWDERLKQDITRFGVPYMPGHLFVPVLSGGDSNGKLVTSAVTFGGPVPRTTMIIRNGQVTKIEGKGRFAKVMRDTFEKYRELRSPKLPGPGINWWQTLAIGTSPKFRISSCWDKMTGSARMHAWGIGHSRSGIIHTGIGQGVISPEQRLMRHVDIFFPTLIADGKTIIYKGRLAALDDPEIVKLAKKFGNPSKLLREDWIPAISGVNS